MTPVAPTLQAFFTDRLTRQLQASPRTIASYRDTLRLLLCFTHEHTGKQPAKLDWDDLNETVITAFLQHLETDRHNTARTRNLRLTAIRSLFKYAALAASGARERDRAGAVDPAQAPPETADLVPHRPGVQGADRRARPIPMGRPPRPRDADPHDPGRSARVRADRAELRRHPARDRRARPLRRQRPQAEDRPAHHTSPSRAHRLADRASRQTGRSAVRDPHRPTAQPRRDRATRHHPRHHRDREAAHRCTANSCTRTSCGTAARCHSSKPASTPPSSPSG